MHEEVGGFTRPFSTQSLAATSLMVAVSKKAAATLRIYVTFRNITLFDAIVIRFIQLFITVLFFHYSMTSKSRMPVF